MKTKADLEEGLITYIVILGLCFLLTDWLSFGEAERGESVEIGRPRSTGWKNFGRRLTRGVGSLLGIIPY